VVFVKSVIGLLKILRAGQVCLKNRGKSEWKSLSEHSCPYGKENCEIGAMCVKCCADNDVYCRY
jgi:hypothetical protein